MIGVFDSGVGGLCAYRQVRMMLPREDMIYLADRKNSPYGTKTPEEIIHLTKNNIKRLRERGADKILIACCSASSIYGMLDREEQEISTPIISPAVKAALGYKKIAVIATRHTALSGAFSREIRKLCDADVTEMPEQELVTLVERGSRDGLVSPECKNYLTNMAERIEAINADCLILGCTHFSHLEGEIGGLLPHLKIISPAREGAIELVRKTIPSRQGCGRDIYT